MITIRPARLPDDKPAFIAFIKALQEYEAVFEKNRRLDAGYAEEHYAALVTGLAKEAERAMVFVAEDGAGRPLGWAVVHEEHSPVFVIEDERRFANLAELFVEEAARGLGAGRALIAACEDWSRSRGFSTMRIGHLAENARAAAVYDKAGYAPYAVQRRKRL